MAGEYAQGVMKKERAQAGSPPGLYRLCLAEMWERAAYYGMRGLLVLFLTYKTQGGLGWSTGEALTLYAIFTLLAGLLPIPGGFLADGLLGPHKAVALGCAAMLVGYLLLALPAGPALYLGLGSLLLGSGLFRPSLITLLGGLYPEGAAQRDGGFTLRYLGIHSGAILGNFVCGIVSQLLGWHWGFGAAGAFMLLGLLTFLTVPSGLLKPSPVTASPASESGSRDLAQQNRARIGIIAILGVFMLGVWTCFESSSLSININQTATFSWTLFGMAVPVGMFKNSASWLTVLLAPMLVLLWNVLAARGRSPSPPVKMGVGLLLMPLGFAFMFGAGKEHQLSGQASVAWLLMTHLLVTLAELCISPTVMSMVTRLAPARFPSLTVGSWLLVPVMANWLAGRAVDPQKNLSVLLFTGVAMAAGGVLLLALAPVLERWLRAATTATRPSPAAPEPGPAHPAP
ncbi:peptide MFS transporter [Pyxidicoccus parkwayensis]|uniref:Peptide MFS transporter n=1 Tax=Pyxidicoccus parkwayensis TaxID=2813578 RepID=A0ABX7NJW6_9BACT|nr:peptide MFS transporter [Pyxidicoccus parkwaysis]QSQ19155.1 peptide MFS transporter [Pyxidicoccus parkwaysis]